MRQVMRKGLITVAAASGVLAVTGGYAHADSSANGSSSDSPGVLSGNSIEAPVDVPVNACGNTINVVGLLNPASGNDCGGSGGDDKAGDQSSDSGAQAGGNSSDSPGVGSGNHVSLPVNVPVNACGNSVGAVSVGNGTTGNGCSDDGGGGGTTTPPADSNTPPSRGGDPGGGAPNDPGTQTVDMPEGESQLGQTGSPRAAAGSPEATGRLAETGSSLPIGAAIPIAGGALLAGALLYRRANAAA
ncbi:chaplin [Streptomyces sp. NPDC002795]|uniref:chaplin n=1 Tax=Streptomyces sp. NPDC002795 TaxID=3364665 RepID=UPI0036D157CC